jgi:hypothetical protein
LQNGQGGTFALGAAAVLVAAWAALVPAAPPLAAGFAWFTECIALKCALCIVVDVGAIVGDIVGVVDVASLLSTC